MASHMEHGQSSEEFCTVQRKKGRGKRSKIRVDNRLLQSTDDTFINVDYVKKKIHQYVEELTLSDFYRQLLVTLRKAMDSLQFDNTVNSVSNIVITAGQGDLGQVLQCTSRENIDRKWQKLECLVFGLGNFASCLIAQYQLALILALRMHLEIDWEKCNLFDPQFTHTEKQILKDFGLTVIKKNEEGKHRCDLPTMVFMPHCGKALFNNLLWSNWSPAALHNLVIIGNSFSSMLTSVPERMWRNHIQYIASIQTFVQEEVVNNNFIHKDIFNDMSIHWFPADNLEKVPKSIWGESDEPAYDSKDLEIILDTT